MRLFALYPLFPFSSPPSLLQIFSFLSSYLSLSLFLPPSHPLPPPSRPSLSFQVFTMWLAGLKLIVDQTGFDLTAILPSLPPKCQDYRYGPPCQVEDMRLLRFCQVILLNLNNNWSFWGLLEWMSFVGEVMLCLLLESWVAGSVFSTFTQDKDHYPGLGSAQLTAQLFDPSSSCSECTIIWYHLCRLLFSLGGISPVSPLAPLVPSALAV